MYELNADEIVRQQCRAREENERHERWMQQLYKEAKQEIEVAEQTIAEQQKRIAELEALLKQRTTNG